MPLFSLGINHHSAPIHIREQFVVNMDHNQALLKDLCRLEAVNEAVLLSTCNRTEIYMAGEHSQGLMQWLGQSCAANISMEPFAYLHQDEAAVRHLMRVITGLDSMVLGEPQIFGQIKQAYRLACEAGTAKQQLQHLFPSAFAAGKMIRSQTQLGANPVSLAYAAVQIAKRIFTHLSHCRVMLIGAGELIELMLTHLTAQPVRQIIVANRTIDKAHQLADACGGTSIRIADIPNHLAQADIVITATASQLPIIGKGLVERTLKNRKRKPILMIDLAVPRDIEPEAGELADIYLYNIDDLQSVIDSNLKNRREAGLQAEALVELQTAHYMRQRQVLQISDIITQFREIATGHRDEATQKARLELAQGRDPHWVISQLAYQLTNKILHQPTMKLRQLAYHQEQDALLFAKKLLTSETNL